LRKRRGDSKGGVDERDVDSAVPLGAVFNERQGGEQPFGVCGVLSCGPS
jgi:hypothetical protein